MIKRSWLAGLYVVASAHLAAAAPVVVPMASAGVQVTVPSEWKASHSGDVGTIFEPTGNAFIRFEVIPGTKEALEKAKDTFSAQLNKVMADFHFTSEMTPKTLNGLKVVIGEAKGTLKAGKKPVEMGIMLVFTPGKKILSVFAMVTADKEAELKAPIIAVVGSIAPLKGKARADAAGDASAAPTSIPAAPAAANGGKMTVVYAPPGDGIPVRKAVREEGVFEILAKNVSTLLKLPHDIPVVFKQCGQINAFYDPQSISITMCDEFTSFFIEAAQKWKGSNQERGLRVLHTLAFFFLHELGHALIDQLHIPAVGREEDAADQIAAVILISNSAAGADIAADGAMSFLSVMQLHKGAPPAFADEHSLDEQRFYNIACLIYGSDPKKYGGMVTGGILPKARAARCPTEWTKISASWNTLLAPYLVKR